MSKETLETDTARNGRRDTDGDAAEKGVEQSAESGTSRGPIDTVQRWLDSLTKEELACAAIIQDDAFVATVIDIVSSWSVTPRSEAETGSVASTTYDTLTRVSPSSVLTTVEAVEERFMTLNKTMDRVKIPRQALANKPANSRLHIDDTGKGADSQLMTNASAAVDDSASSGKVDRSSREAETENALRIEGEKVPSDDYRIRNGKELIATVSQAEHEETARSLESIRCIFPSIIDFIAEQRKLELPSRAEGARQPVLAFEPSSLADVSLLVKRVSRCYHEYEQNTFASTKPFWFHWLIHRSNEKASRSSQISIATVIEARLEVALTEAYGASKGQPSGTDGLIPVSALKDIIFVSNELGNLVEDDDMAVINALLGGKNTEKGFPTCSLAGVIAAFHGDKRKNFAEFDETFVKVVSELWNRAQSRGFSLRGEKEAEENLPTQATPASGTAPTRKKKKKRNKKKKKATTADAAVQATEDGVEGARVLSQRPPIVPIVKEEKAVMPALADIGRSMPVKADDELLAVAPSFDASLASVATDASQSVLDLSIRSGLNVGEGIRISRVEGVGTTVVVAPSVTDPKSKDKPSVEEAKGENNDDHEDDDDDAWETVESKSRSNRSRKRETLASALVPPVALGVRKTKTGRTSASRKRLQNRKVVREILSNILDGVDAEVRRKRQEEALKAAEMAREEAIARRAAVVARGTKNKAASAKDAFLGRQRTSTGIVNSPKSSSQKTVADQSTTQTVPETLSGASASNTQSSINTDMISDAVRPRISTEESPEAEDVSMNDTRAESKSPARSEEEAETSPPPPLQMLGPGITNSATSSVASSLEAPHTCNRRHHHSSANEDTVGYHLLDVCERLSRDMNVFMMRRSTALSTRRRERGALVAALQETTSTIWPDHGHVETYGSCATMLDLPSSDVDVVIGGLDDPSAQGSQSSRDENPYFRSPVNAERVLRLSAELEMQPWAVQVKAIPTASVPVIKVLADPSRLPGAAPSASNREWAMQHSMVVQGAATAGMNFSPPGDQSYYVPTQNSGDQRVRSHYAHPWRGADVMNGLFKIDITFEGREHGGIGSTNYSAEVVQEACVETGLPAERTPIVQVLMVLKELLAQRRLNEPFSGGLSSYALLLLLVAVVKERKAIREEMERIERHRRGLEIAGTSRTLPVEDSPSTPASRSDFVSPEASKSGRKGSLLLTDKEKAPAAHRSSPRTPPSMPSISNPKDGAKARQTQKATPTTKAPSKKQQVTKPAQPGPKTTQSAVKGAETQKAKEVSRSDAPTTSSWASMLRKSTLPKTNPAKASGPVTKPQAETKSQPKKISSFAEAVSGTKSVPKPKPVHRKPAAVLDKDKPAQPPANPKRTMAEVAKGASQRPSATPRKIPTPATPQKGITTAKQAAPQEQQKQKHSPAPKKEVSKRDRETEQLSSREEPSVANPGTEQNSLSGGLSMFPQGSNDVLEVLCSGETTAGKLLMHFLLFYGQHFDSRTTAIDVTGSHHEQSDRCSHFSPYIPRRTGGAIDPVTGMLTVDPIVLFDPWAPKGARENSNVARSCYAWSSIRWHFAQCYMTLSSAVERSGTPPTTPAVADPSPDATRSLALEGETGNETPKETTDQCPDTVSPLLELLLSF